METKQNHSVLKIFLFFLFSVIVLFMCCGASVLVFYFIINNSNIPGSISSDNQTLDYSYSYGNQNSSNKLLSIPISGVILDIRPADSSLSFLLPQDVTYGYEIKTQLKDAVDDSSIAGVILEISSPGGTISGTKAIADGVAYYKKQTNKPIIAHIMGLGASGAYWSAVSTDYIFADSGSLSGSIGVIFGPFQEFNTVLQMGDSTTSITTKDGINEFYLTGGGFKDFGNPFRKMSDEEKTILQEGIDNEYNIFVKFVSTRRDISETTIKQSIKALVYDNVKAIELKLIDASGSLDDAYSYLAEKTNLGFDYQVVKVKSPDDFWSSIFGKFLAPSNLNASNLQTAKSCSHLCYRPVVVYGNPAELDK